MLCSAADYDARSVCVCGGGCVYLLENIFIVIRQILKKLGEKMIEYASTTDPRWPP